jgi:hypothetical protein
MPKEELGSGRRDYRNEDRENDEPDGEGVRRHLVVEQPVPQVEGEKESSPERKTDARDECRRLIIAAPEFVLQSAGEGLDRRGAQQQPLPSRFDSKVGILRREASDATGCLDNHLSDMPVAGERCALLGTGRQDEDVHQLREHWRGQRARSGSSGCSVGVQRTPSLAGSPRTSRGAPPSRCVHCTR